MMVTAALDMILMRIAGSITNHVILLILLLFLHLILLFSLELESSFHVIAT